MAVNQKADLMKAELIGHIGLLQRYKRERQKENSQAPTAQTWRADWASNTIDKPLFSSYPVQCNHTEQHVDARKGESSLQSLKVQLHKMQQIIVGVIFECSDFQVNFRHKGTSSWLHFAIPCPVKVCLQVLWNKQQHVTGGLHVTYICYSVCSGTFLKGGLLRD